MSGTVTGRVYDSRTREPIPFANVVVVGTSLGGAADINGEFSILRIPLGSYALRASAVGFQPMIRTDVVLSPVRPVRLEFGLMETSIELGEVTVTGGFFQKQTDKPVSLQTQSYEEIRRLPGGLEDVVRAVSILPGVAQVQAGRNDLIVRGGAPSENLFVIDNIEVPNINHFRTQGASGGPLSFVNLDFVQETSFSTGGFGVRYGDKLSSVLTIDLKEGRNDRFGGKGTISASQFGLNLEGPVDGSGSYLFSARRSYLDFIFKAAGFGFVPEYWDFLGKVSYAPGRNDQISVIGLAAIDNVRLFNDTADKRFTNSRILYSSQNQVVGGISWRRLFGGGFGTVTFGQVFVDYDF
ncbi:MAG: TonB-dependent receptor, partial [Bacteroidota bacterium]